MVVGPSRADHFSFFFFQKFFFQGRPESKKVGPTHKKVGPSRAESNFFLVFFFLEKILPGLLLTIMPSCHVFGRFLFFFPSCHHHATGGGGAGLSLSITWGFPPRWHDGMMA